MKKIATFLFASTLAMAAMAVPAKRQTITLHDAQGVAITAIAQGDEYFHYFIDATTGEYLLLNDDGTCYKPSLTEFYKQQQAGSNRRENHQAFTRRKMQQIRANRVPEVREEDKTPFDLNGKRKALVILVEFQDTPMHYDRERMNRHINEVGYHDDGQYGSVHDYFYGQSYGKFDLEFDVVGPVKVSQDLKYYGTNDRNGNDQYVGTMVAEACELAHESGVNFADYDWDNDGEAEMITLIYTGYGEAQAYQKSYLIWPMQWYLSEAAEYNDGPGRFNLGGTFIDRFLVLNELSGSYGTKLDGIGTFCHEYSHGLGLPDFYDTCESGCFGMDAWDLMDYGCYNDNSHTPCGYTSYERMFCGWLTPYELTEPSTVVDMKPITDAPEAYVVYNQGNRNEFFLLDNRQQHGWNAYDQGHGLLIMHVDYDANVWYGNVVNTKYPTEYNTNGAHEHFTIVPADNGAIRNDDENGFAGDPFPGTEGNTEFSDTSEPKASLYHRNADNRKYLGHPITEITETFGDDPTDGRISFNFDGGGKVIDNSTVGVGAPSLTVPLVPHNVYDIYGRRSTKQAHGLRIENGVKRLND